MPHSADSDPTNDPARADDSVPVERAIPTIRTPAQIAAAVVGLVVVLGGFFFATWYVVSAVIRAEH